MFKSSTLSLVVPKVESTTKTATRKPISATQINRRSSKALSILPANLEFTPILAVSIIAALGLLLVMHVFWINTYSAKGFDLKKLQTSIDQQTVTQKKLLVQQSLLNSSLSLGEAGQKGLVPVNDIEHLSGNSLAQAK